MFKVFVQIKRPVFTDGPLSHNNIYDLSNLQFNNVQCTIDLQFSNLIIYRVLGLFPLSFLPSPFPLSSERGRG